jgi:WD40 repeat protein
MNTGSPRKTIFVLLVLLVVLSVVLNSGGLAAAAQTDQGNIAYIRSGTSTGDEIWLIQPDGTYNRKIWQMGTPGVEGLQDVFSLSFSPNGSEVAFSGRHENGCSFYYSDIYAVRVDGSGYRRVTAPPACGQRSGLPKGSVTLQVGNMTSTGGPFTVYFEGAEAPQEIFLAPGTSTTLTFNNVADYGSRVQWAVAMFGQDRFHHVLANADVIPGQTVATKGLLPISFSTYYWGWQSPTWRYDGSRLAYVFEASSAFFSLPANNQIPGETGEELTAVPIVDRPGSPEFLSYAPTASRGNQLLYVGYDFWGDGATIFLISEGSTSPGQILVPIGGGIGAVVLGLAWLPDGSGFLYSATEEFNERANLYLYQFSQGTSTKLTNFSSGFTRKMSVSPDGQQVIFERQSSGEWTDEDPPIALWKMTITGSTPTLFLEGARSPSWGITAVSQPPPPPSGGIRYYLPLISR